MGYFPAYEIVTEELRDHRFYAADLAHPSDWTINYIIQRFFKSRFDEKSQEFEAKLMQFLKMKAHRVRSEDQLEINKWQDQLDAEERKIRGEYPMMNHEFING
jgi:hypothetical protein